MAKGSFGGLLKRERELREISLNELTKATRVSPRFLEALENEDWSKLPGGAFNRGFIRAIARYLGLSEEHFLSEYDMARSDDGPSVSSARPNPIPSPSKWLVAIALLAALVALGGLLAGGVYGWRRYAAHRAAKRAIAASIQSQPQSPSPSASEQLPNLMPEVSASSQLLDLKLSTSTTTRIRMAKFSWMLQCRPERLAISLPFPNLR